MLCVITRIVDFRVVVRVVTFEESMTDNDIIEASAKMVGHCKEDIGFRIEYLNTTVFPHKLDEMYVTGSAFIAEARH